MGLKRSFNLDKKSTTYTEISYSTEKESAKIEWGVTTTYEEINYVTSKVGLEYRPTTADKKMEAYELEPADAPRKTFEATGILFPLPSGVPVPIG